MPFDRHLVLAVALALAACATPLTSPTRPSAAGMKRDKATPSASGPSSQAGLPEQPESPPDRTSAVQANDGLAVGTAARRPTGGVTLAGRALAPATLIGDAGGALIGDAGGSLVGKHGGSYRLLQTKLSQVPVPQARVTLLDANGSPLRGPDGQPLLTETDTAGAYAFTTALPPQAMIVNVTPKGLSGALSRVVAPGVSQADVDYASTLVTSFVLQRYVRTQPDPQATLNKLSAQVEAETVAIAARAAGESPTAASLASETILTKAETLQRNDSAFGKQLELVRQILIPAGASNLGLGLPADQVFMGTIRASAAASDGTLYLHAVNDHLFWRVTPDGRLEIAAGNGEVPRNEPADRQGQQASEISLEYCWGAWCDAQGRLTVHEDKHGVWRLEPDGKVTTLHRQADLDAAFAGTVLPHAHLRPDGTLVAQAAGGLWALPPGGSKVKLADTGSVYASGGLTELPQGRSWMGIANGELYGFSPDAPPELLLHKSWIAEGSTLTSLDSRGNFFYVSADDGQIHQVKPDGTERVLLPTSALRPGVSWIREGLDGVIYASDMTDSFNAVVRRIEADGTAPIIAGIDGLPKGLTRDGRIPLANPEGLHVAPDGTLLIADNGALMKVPPQAAAEIIASKGLQVEPNQAVTFTGVHRLADGRLLARGFSPSKEVILRQSSVGGDWRIILSETRTWGNAWNISMHAWAVAPDGTIVVSRHTSGNGAGAVQAQVLRLKAGEDTPSVLVPAAAGLEDIAKLVFSPDGGLHLRGRKSFQSPDKTRHFLVAADGSLSAAPAGVLAAEAQDQQGRLYEGDATAYTLGNYGDRRIRRQKPGEAAEVFAGQGTSLLGGKTLDDSVGVAEDLQFDAAGNLYLRDRIRRQVRRIPRERL
ncbi:MAG: hypothetical protein VKP62_14345 [Candidatus Sericytochromatia bacterium]|nr:hypothetical protein [Candidatus Sericytochromatia bacterium]